MGPALAAALLASACALKTPPAHDAVVQEALPEQTDIPPGWTAAGDSAAVANDWVASFGDAGLVAAVNEAVANNPDVRVAAARVEVARNAAIVVGSALKPQVGGQVAGAGTLVEGESAPYWSGTAGVGAGWEIDLWGKLRARRAATEARYQATALDYAFAIQSLAAMTARSWYLALETRLLLQLTRDAVAIYSNLLDLVRIQRAAGRVSDLDVAEASANLNQAESDLRTAEAAYTEARRGLEVMIGRYPAAELDVAQAFVNLPEPPGTGIPATLLERRPDLLAAEQQVLAAFRSEEATRLALLPSFSLRLVGGLLGDQILSILKLNPWLLHGTIGAAIPIYTGGRLQAEVRIATAQQQGAVAAYGSAILAAFREVENALTNERLLGQKLGFDEATVRDRAEAVRIARIKYEAGAIDLLSVLQLQASLLASEGELIKLRTAQRTNRITLYLAVGGGFDSTAAANVRPAQPSAAR